MEMNLRDKPTDEQVILEYYSGERLEASMTEHQQEKLRRIRLCVSMLLDAQPHFMIIGKMMKVCDISQGTAYRDLNLTRRLFGKILKSEKEMWRAMAVEMALSDRQAAIKVGDLKARNAATKNFITASGIENEDPDLPDFKKLQPSIIITLLPPGMDSKIDTLLQGGAINLNEFPATIDTEYEEVDSGT